MMKITPEDGMKELESLSKDVSCRHFNDTCIEILKKA